MVLESKIETWDIQQILGYSHYLLMKGQLAGNMRIDGHRASKEEVEIAGQYRSFCDNITKRISSCKVGAVPYFLACYDFFYRMGYQRLPDDDFISRNKQRVFNASLGKADGIEESALIGMIAMDVKSNPVKAGKEYVRVYKTTIKDWVETLRKFHTFPNVSSYERYQRLAIVMRENLDGLLFEDADKAKRRWYEKNKVEAISTLGSLILRSYRQFASSLFPSVLGYDEVVELDNQIAQELSNRKDLDAYDRQAFRMVLEHNKVYAEG